MEIFDCIVVGGGIIGSCTSYDLVKRAKNILVIDQFALPHTRGSSHGPIRLLRLAHPDPVFSRMALDSLPLWEHLEQQSKTTLLRKTGAILIDKPPFEHVDGCVKSAKQLGIPCCVLSRDDVHRKFPGLVTLPEGHKACYEEESRTLRADKSLNCLRERIKDFGGKFRDEEKVVSITPGEIITIRTNKGTYRTTGLVLAPGSWASQLLEPFGIHPPIRVKRATVCYWRESRPGQTADYPVFIDASFDHALTGKVTSEPFFGFGFPSSEYLGLRKIGIHYGTETNPDVRDDNREDESSMKIIRSYIYSRFPELDKATRPSILESCIYTDSADGGIIIDTVPHHDNIVYCCGLSGSGFKAAPMVGRVLAEKALGETTSYDLASFRLSRFPGTFVQSKH